MHEWKDLITHDGDVLLDNFWSGIKVWIERPHIINKRVVGVEVLQTIRVACDENIGPTLLSVSLQANVHVTDLSYLLQNCNPVSIAELYEDQPNGACQLRRLIPRNTKLDGVEEIVVIDKLQKSVLFLPLCCNSASSVSVPFPYKIAWKEQSVSLLIVETGCEVASQQHQGSTEWLKSQVFPKLLNWMTFVPKFPIIPSLCQVPMQAYSKNYSTLKQKYGKRLVEVWPEKTDPSKFVYEDIAIAAYLLTVWEEERSLTGQTEKQSFVDLGCGNGLLVYLLSSEGHRGIGIDIRKRNIWDFYGPETNLIEKEIIPSASELFPNFDWIIGNHSDELTPWIPVIAARSSYRMKVFLLPCCAYTFDGKYDRGNSSSSKYQSYLDFVEDLCVAMGFNVQRDKLRIPSTKRVCFICTSRSYGPESEEERDRSRTEFIRKHSKLDCGNFMDVDSACSIEKSCLESDAWSRNFSPREKIELVRNCCSLDPEFINGTVVRILNILLACGETCIELENKKCLWKCGGEMDIKLLAEELDKEILSKLKSQCGGLKTLLRNHKSVFMVNKGRVSLRTPSKFKDESRSKKCQATVKSFSKKPCIFFFHHPGGCPFSEECTFSHEKDD